MKNIKINAFLLLFALVAGLTAVKAQDKKAAAVLSMLEQKNFIFKAQTALPMSGRSINLTSDYDLTIKPDAIVSYLPFYGRAYSAPINSSEGGIKFTSTDFAYQSNKAKKHGWNITIKPNDVSEVQNLNLVVFENGNATLQVNNQNKQSISFQGYITEGKPLEKKGF